MSREEFIAKHANELSGFLLEAFIVQLTEAERDPSSKVYSAARKGEFMLTQMERAREMLGKLFDQLPGPALSSAERKRLADAEAALEKIKKANQPAKSITLAEVKNFALELSKDDRVKFRAWIEGSPKETPEVKK